MVRPIYYRKEDEVGTMKYFTWQITMCSLNAIISIMACFFFEKQVIWVVFMIGWTILATIFYLANKIMVKIDELQEPLWKV